MRPIWPDETDFSEAVKDKAIQWGCGAVGNLAVEAPALGPDDRRKHLDYIQVVVTRQSAASASAKSWLLPIVTATFGFALTQDSWPLAALGLVSVMLFADLDANYLRSEKRFRKLYNTVARSRDEPPEDKFQRRPSGARSFEIISLNGASGNPGPSCRSTRPSRSLATASWSRWRPNHALRESFSWPEGHDGGLANLAGDGILIRGHRGHRGYCPKPAAPRPPRAVERVRTSNSAGCFRDVAESATSVRDQPAESTGSRASAMVASWGCSPYGGAASAVLPGVSVVPCVKKRSFVHAGPALMPHRLRSR